MQKHRKVTTQRSGPRTLLLTCQSIDQFSALDNLIPTQSANNRGSEIIRKNKNKHFVFSNQYNLRSSVEFSGTQADSVANCK